MRGDGSIFKQKGSRFWWARYYLNGKQFRESTQMADETKARKYLKHRLKEVGAAQLGLAKFVTPAQHKITISELLDGLKTDYEIRGKWNARVRAHVRALKADLSEFRACELTKRHVEQYIQDRQQAGRANATINNELQLLHQAYQIGDGVGEGPKVKRLPLDNAREGFFEKADFEALIKELPETLQDFTRFAFLVGWRKGEICSLRWSELDMEGKTLRLRILNRRTAKRGKSRLTANSGS